VLTPQAEILKTCLRLLLMMWLFAPGVSAAAPLAHGNALELLQLEVIPGSSPVNTNWRQLEVRLQSQAPEDLVVTISGSVARPLVLKPALHTLQIGPGHETVVKFRVYNPSGQWHAVLAPLFSVHFVAEGLEYSARVSEPWPVGSTEESMFHRPGIPWAASVLAVLGILLLFPRLRSRVAGGIKGLAVPENFVSLLVLLAVEAFIILHLSPASLLTSTITTGGDTASHFYTLSYLVNELLPNGQISGWTPGNYAGFPILQFYFPLVFLFMALLDGFMSLEVAFKLGSILGMLLLPLGAYGMLRLLRVPFPAPAIAALLTLPFLFNAENSMWGGNMLSSLAGEFSYGLSLAISLVALGSLYRGAVENRHVVLNALLIFLVGFSHGYTLLFVEAMSV